MDKAHAIGTQLTVTMNGETEIWTKLDSETWNTAGGTDGMAFVSFERDDMVDAVNEAVKLVQRYRADYSEEGRWAYADAHAELERANDAIRLMNLFFPELES